MLKAIYKFEQDKLIHSSKMVIPIILLITYIVCSYTVAPLLKILDSFSAASSIVFALMMSIGFMYGDINYNMIDQTICVKLPKMEYFYFGKVIIMAQMSLMFALISVFIPLIMNVCYGFALFKRSIVFSDICSGIILFYLVGMSGSLIGLIFNQRIIKLRKYAILLCMFLCIVTIVKEPINREFIIAKFFTWLMPPVYDLGFFYSKDAYFNLSNTWIYFIWLIGYIIIEIIAYVKIMVHKGFE